MDTRAVMLCRMGWALRRGSYAVERLGDWLLARSIDCYVMSSKYEPGFRPRRP